MESIEVRLRDGSICHGDKFDLNDYRKLQCKKYLTIGKILTRN